MYGIFYSSSPPKWHFIPVRGFILDYFKYIEITHLFKSISIHFSELENKIMSQNTCNVIFYVDVIFKHTIRYRLLIYQLNYSHLSLFYLLSESFLLAHTLVNDD